MVAVLSDIHGNLEAPEAVLADRAPRAPHALHDDSAGVVVIRRVDCPVPRMQERIRSAGLCLFLLDRLGAGFHGSTVETRP